MSENNIKFTPQEAFDNVTRTLSFLRPLTYIQESLKAYMDSVKEKEALDQDIANAKASLEGLRQKAEEWRKEQDLAREQQKEIELSILNEYKAKANDAIKWEEERLVTLKKNIELERTQANKDLDKLKDIFIANKHKADEDLMKVGKDIVLRKKELDNLEVVAQAKVKELEKIEQAQSARKNAIQAEIDKVTASYNAIQAKFDAIKKAALALGN